MKVRIYNKYEYKLYFGFLFIIEIIFDVFKFFDIIRFIVFFLDGESDSDIDLC